MKRALILGPGGLRGAYGGGVAATLGRKLGRDYFDSLYTCSAGAYTGSYLASGQPDMIEAIWRECVHGKLLMRWHNVVRANKPILDLFYLNQVLRSNKYRLLVKDMLCGEVKMFMVATECSSGHARYLSPRTPEEFFLHVRASAAVPYLHPKVVINGKEYVDGRFSDPLPIERALADGHEEIVVVCNKSELNMSCLNFLISAICTISYPGRRKMLAGLEKMHNVATMIERNSACVRVIFPSSEPAVSWPFDSSREHINRLVDLGIHDALAFLA